MLNVFKIEALKIKNFKNLWLAQATSQFGDAFYTLVFMFMIDHYTHKPEMVGLMGAVEMLPFLLFSPYAGVVADRIDRKKIMMIADISSAILLLIFGAFVLAYGQPPLIIMFITAFGLSTINAFFTPSKSASIPMLVPKNMLMEANGLSTATQNMMPVVGIGLSASMLVSVQKMFPDLFFPTAILVNAFAFIGSTYFLSRLPILLPPKSNSPQESVYVEYMQGIKYILKNRPLKIAMFLEFLVFLSLAPFMTVYVTVNREWFGGEYSTFASIELAYALAAVLGSLIVSKLVIKRICTPYVTGLIVASASIAGMAFGTNFWVFILMNIICGLAIPFYQISLTTFIQLSVHGQYLGRVNSILSMMTWGAMPVGMVVAGYLVQNHGITLTLLLESICFALICILGLINSSFRNALMPTQQLPQNEVQVKSTSSEVHNAMTNRSNSELADSIH